MELIPPNVHAPVWVADRDSLEELTRRPEVVVSDTIEDQLREFLLTQSIPGRSSPEAIERQIRDTLGQDEKSAYGHWVYYPWSRRLVHLLPEREFRLLRSNRNRYKITSHEQELLRARLVGIVGLSVGFPIARTMAMEGVAGSFRLADFDHISLSNTNRLDAGVHNLGVNKAIHAARRLYEIDPFLSIAVYPEGVQADTVDAFLRSGRPIDLLLEECDTLPLKIRLRERAREFRIPVVMETNDRGMLDIERFDREPDRPILHGLVGLSADEIDRKTMPEMMPLVIRILGRENISPRGAASLLELGETLTNWPQLASGAELGGAVATDVIRRIFLGELTVSGRFFVDLHSIVSNARTDVPQTSSATDAANRASAEQKATVPQAENGPIDFVSPSSENDVRRRVSLDVDTIRDLVHQGIAAPSFGNSQPWHFVYRRGPEALDCYLDSSRANSFLDYERHAARASIGAAVENIVISASARDLDVRVEFEPVLRREPISGTPELPKESEGGSTQPPDPSFALVCRLTFFQGSVKPDASLVDSISKRCTNRKGSAPSALSASEISRLTCAADIHGHGARLHLVTEPSALAALGEILSEIERVRMLSAQTHHDFMSQVRWSRDEVERTRDGLNVEELELNPIELDQLHLLSSSQVIDFLRKTNIGSAAKGNVGRKLSSASAAGLLSMPTSSPIDTFLGGRTLQRVWLEATQLGLALQPLTTAPYLFTRLASAPDDFSIAERKILSELLARYSALLPTHPPETQLSLFRISKAAAPSTRSLRRPLSDVLLIQ